MNYLKRIIEKIKDKFKFNFYFNRRINKQYISLFVIPTIFYIYDSQGNETLVFEDATFDSTIETSINVTWLWFSAGMELKIKTYKPEIKVED